MASSISERFVALNRPHNTPGVLVHRAPEDGFISLYAVPYWDMDNPPTPPDNANNIEANNTIRVTFGHNKNALVARTFNAPHVVCQNMWVQQGEEVYASAETVNKLAMYGYTSKRPLG